MQPLNLVLPMSCLFLIESSNVLASLRSKIVGNGCHLRASSNFSSIFRLYDSSTVGFVNVILLNIERFGVFFVGVFCFVGVLVLRVVAAFFFLGEGDDNFDFSGLKSNASSLVFVEVCSGILDNVVFLNIIII